MKQMEGLEKKLNQEKSPSPKRGKKEVGRSVTGEEEEKSGGSPKRGKGGRSVTPEREEEKSEEREKEKSEEREKSNTGTKCPPLSVKPKTPNRSKVVPRLTDPELSPFFPKDPIQRSSIVSPNKPVIKSPIAASKNQNKNQNQNKNIRSLQLNRERFGSIFSDGRDGRSPKGSVETTTLSGDDDDTATDNDELLSESSNSRINCFNIDSMPGARLLSKSEKKMCENLRLTPSFYINVKGMIIKVRIRFKRLIHT